MLTVKCFTKSSERFRCEMFENQHTSAQLLRTGLATKKTFDSNMTGEGGRVYHTAEDLLPTQLLRYVLNGYILYIKLCFPVLWLYFSLP